MGGKAEATRERILEAAIALFGQKGYAQTTMREIAQAAGCSLGLAYRYFETKDAMVLALYERMVEELVQEVEALPAQTLGRRWALAERADLARLAPHRETLSGLFSAGLSPSSPVQVLGETTRPLRRRMHALFAQLLAGAKDAPKASLHAPLTTLFYAAHLLLVLFWLQDRTGDQRATAALIAFGEEMIGRLPLLLKLPWVAPSLVRLAGILGPLFGDD
jgi:AcrR family transcriptional regulator